MVGAGPGMNVIDLCAGAGGKTLAVAAAMQNKGQIYAYDEDRLRLKPIFDRVHRSGLRNIQILRGGDKQALGALGAKFDRVLVDAPCTGSGTWRRRPDAKWKLKPEAVLNRIKEQREVLKRRRAPREIWRTLDLCDVLYPTGRKRRTDLGLSQGQRRVFACPLCGRVARSIAWRAARFGRRWIGRADVISGETRYGRVLHRCYGAAGLAPSNARLELR